MEKRRWFKKFAWVTTLDLMYWHRGKEYFGKYINQDIYIAGKILLGEEYRYCDMTCIPAEIEDKTGVYYSEEAFLRLLKDYYSEENVTPFDNINFIYNLHRVIGNLNWQTAPEKYQNALVKLIETSTHATSKAFLITILSDLYFKIGLKSKAINLLKIIPHERRRSYVFLKLLHKVDVDEEKGQFDEFLKYISNEDDREIALELKQEIGWQTLSPFREVP